MPTKGYRIGDTPAREPVYPPHEDRHVFTVWSPNMRTAAMAINKTGTAHHLRMIVPDVKDDGYWLIYKDDSWVREQWQKHFPNALTLLQ